jgi:hypothetical protein
MTFLLGLKLRKEGNKSDSVGAASVMIKLVGSIDSRSKRPPEWGGFL